MSDGDEPDLAAPAHRHAEQRGGAEALDQVLAQHRVPGRVGHRHEAPAVMTREISDGPPSHWRYCASCAPPTVPSPTSPSCETSVRWTWPGASAACSAAISASPTASGDGATSNASERRCAALS